MNSLNTWLVICLGKPCIYDEEPYETLECCMEHPYIQLCRMFSIARLMENPLYQIFYSMYTCMYVYCVLL